MSTGALESLLDDDDVNRGRGWEDWHGGETVHQVGVDVGAGIWCVRRLDSDVRLCACALSTRL